MNTELFTVTLAMLCLAIPVVGRAQHEAPTSEQDIKPLLIGASIPDAGDTNRLETIVTRIREHVFHPVRDGFTYDRNLDTHGIADIRNDDWRVRLLAARDLVRLGTDAPEQVITALHDANVHVRHVAAMALGIVRATNAVFALERA